jgi:hypothetical protein
MPQGQIVPASTRDFVLCFCVCRPSMWSEEVARVAASYLGSPIMRTSSTRVGRFAVLLATPVAILATGALIFHASYAAFSATTRNAGNNWAVGAVALTNDSAGTARFQVTNMVPGQTETKCITVTANASVAGVVKAYAIDPVTTSSGGLESRILISSDIGTGGSFADCTGFTKVSTDFTALPLSTMMLANSYASGFGGWAVGTGTSSRTYEITWTFDTTGLTQDQLNALQGMRTGIDFQWELQSG